MNVHEAPAVGRGPRIKRIRAGLVARRSASQESLAEHRRGGRVARRPVRTGRTSGRLQPMRLGTPMRHSPLPEEGSGFESLSMNSESPLRGLDVLIPPLRPFVRAYHACSVACKAKSCGVQHAAGLWLMLLRCYSQRAPRPGSPTGSVTPMLRAVSPSGVSQTTFVTVFADADRSFAVHYLRC